MAALLVSGFSPGRIAWSMIRDEEGHRDYTVVHRVETTSPHDGPDIVANAPGLPLVGSFWQIGNGIDLWAFCHPFMRVTPDQTPGGEPHRYWTVEQLFSTRPLSKCGDEFFEDPLLQPPRISGSFIRNTTEVLFDTDGNAILNSCHEHVRDIQVELNEPVVTIEQNVLDLELGKLYTHRNAVNDDVMWSLAARKIRLANSTWSKNYYGTCYTYYTRILNFEAGDWDVIPSDFGTKFLNGHWNQATGAWVLDNINGAPPDPDKPNHFIVAKDKNDEILGTQMLDGAGKPSTTNVPVPIPLATASGGAVKLRPETDFITEFNLPAVL